MVLCCIIYTLLSCNIICLPITYDEKSSEILLMTTYYDRTYCSHCGVQAYFQFVTSVNNAIMNILLARYINLHVDLSALGIHTEKWCY